MANLSKSCLFSVKNRKVNFAILHLFFCEKLNFCHKISDFRKNCNPSLKLQLVFNLKKKATFILTVCSPPQATEIPVELCHGIQGTLTLDENPILPDK